MPKILFNGPEGTRWTNDTGRVRYQFHASLINTCGYCLQFHMAIGPIWPIPMHKGCRCQNLPIAPGAESQPFIDFRQVLADMPHSQQVAAVGAANWRLIESGLVAFEHVVGAARVKPFYEVVAAQKLSLPDILKAGVSRPTAERAYASVHTPAIELARHHANQLIEQITKTGLSREQIYHIVGQKLAEKVGIAEGPSGPSQAKIEPADVPALIEELKQVQKAVTTRAAMRSTNRSKARRNADEMKPLKAVAAEAAVSSAIEDESQE